MRVGARDGEFESWDKPRGFLFHLTHFRDGEPMNEKWNDLPLHTARKPVRNSQHPANTLVIAHKLSRGKEPP